MKAFTLFLLLIVVCGLLALQPGSWLIVNNLQKSDAIVALGAYDNDLRYLRGLELLRTGYGNNLIEDVPVGEIYGQRTTELASRLVAQTAGSNLSQVRICPIRFDSTMQEADDVHGCLEQIQPHPRSVVLVTDDYHSRRALSIFRKRLPQYQWSVAATPNRYFFGLPWWKQREWAKTYFLECQKLLYWEAWDRWRN